VELERWEVTEARKTLGFKTAPTGDNADQFEHMLEASQKWAAHIKASHLRQIDAWLALRSTIWKTLVYPLICMTLTEKQIALTHGSRSIGRRPASPLYSPMYCTSEHFSVS
jgi:hypothetical protein